MVQNTMGAKPSGALLCLLENTFPASGRRLSAVLNFPNFIIDTFFSPTYDLVPPKQNAKFKLV
jgi:hypothetical protein